MTISLIVCLKRLRIRHNHMSKHLSKALQDMTIITCLCFSYAETWKVSPKSAMIQVLVIGEKMSTKQDVTLNDKLKDGL